MLPYPQLFLLAMFCALLIAPIVTRLAQKFGIVDAPGVRKVHTKTVACLGGVSIFISITCPLLITACIPNAVGGALRHVPHVVLVIAASSFYY